MSNITIDMDEGSLYKEIEAIARERVKNAARKIADELTLYAQSCILDFYSHYDPKRYRRQHGLFDSPKRYYKNPHNTIYYGGVELFQSSGSYTGWHNGGYVSINAEWPTALAIFGGKHGAVEEFPHPPASPPVMSPTPFELITKRRDEIIDNLDSYIN